MIEIKRILFLSLLLPSVLFSYSFGKNKIQYRDFDWQILETKHFRIFYYAEGERIANFAAFTLEDAFEEYQSILHLHFDEKIPVIIYNGPIDFQQTNVTLNLVDEGVGGFTEIFKKRVVVPFSGSYKEFRHVLRHELVHVFQFTLFMKGFNPALSLSPLLRIPLWVMEGSAEYFSLHWDTKTEAYMRDLVFNDQLVPVSKLGDYGGYIIYKEGQAIYYFIEKKYGRQKIGEFFHQIAMRKELGSAIKSTFGLDLKEFDEEFTKYMKLTYYPEIKNFSLPSDREKEITNHTREGGFMNVAPTLSPDGNQLAFISDKSGYTDIYLTSGGGGEIKKIVSGERNPSLENLHIFRPGLSFSPDGKRLVFVAQAGPKDVLHVVKVPSGKIIKTISFPVDGLYTPSWSPGGRYIAVVGIEGGKSDIFIYDLDENEIRRLTNDPYDDRDPSFSRDGKKVLFASDRNHEEGFHYGSYGVYEYNLKDNTIMPLFQEKGDISSPLYVSDSFVVFIGEKNGAINLFGYSKVKKSFYRVTNYFTDLAGPSISAKGDKIAFSLLWKGGWDIFMIKNPFEGFEPTELVDVPYFSADTLSYAGQKRKSYGISFSIDWLAGAMEYSDAFGLYGAMTIGLSDALGNHRISFTSDLYSDLANSNFNLNYLYLPKRTDFGFSFYQYWQFYPISSDYMIVERQLGLETISLYPLDRFKRIEGGIGYSRPHRYLLYYNPLTQSYETIDDYTLDVFDFYGGFVVDKTLYSYIYPLDGYRFYVGGEKSISGLRYNLFWTDARKYFRLTKRTVWAFRGIYGSSWGRDRLTLWMGGPNSLRGYDYYEFIGYNLLLFNSELRVPFVDYLKIAFPIPLELRGLRGVLFFDAGAVWDDSKTFRPFQSTEYGFKFKDVKGSIGIGLRLGLGFADLKFDAARATDLTRFLRPTRYYLTLGSDF